jgi:nucleoside-diphosphate-sugar epimerase
VNKLTADAIRKRLITVHGGEQRRPNVGMTDVIHLYSQLLDADPARLAGRTFNFGFENLKVIEIARVIQRELADRTSKSVCRTLDKGLTSRRRRS